MRANTLAESNFGVSFSGTCPHCTSASVFIGVGSPKVDYEGIVNSMNSYRTTGAMQCQGCKNFILGQAIVYKYTSGSAERTDYVFHYPLSKPNDSVAAEIPEHIQPDFKEALRCQFVDAWNVTAEMCRRAIEASCIDLGVPTNKIKVLEGMIDWLEQERKITPFLRDVAHKIRLGGNRGAHPPEDGAGGKPPAEEMVGPISIIEKEHADAIVQFTKEFFHHVYVVPKQLKKYDFSKPKVTKN